ncbi:hypothetical protein JAAARDRAFT_33030 [Jaapia argillacea MUCL 33604]|uniref:CHCH domain-containing protein n=1 Tax=Jaapia argillacea MUCL 33604 TaxID=933084 RepID=A0A067PXQ3_9AGAM|nr:hypothetical protein JAAARDRAFT_33030 [Jaapia argillacea MUCL 33604]
MHIKRIKVRPKKNVTVAPCGPELASMLGCWAANGDLHSINACSQASQALFECMRTAPMKMAARRPTINYHLARLGKNLK